MNFEIIAGGISAILAGVKSLALVEEGQLGSKRRFGKASRNKDGKIQVIKPGFVLLIPFIDSIKKAHIRMDSLELNDLNVTLKNGLSYHYSAFVAYHVSEAPDDLEKFLYRVENPHQLISQRLSSAIRELLTKEGDAQNATGEEINKRLSEILKEYLKEKIGVILDSCGLTSLTESEQAQQVNVSIAKLEHAIKHYGSKVQVPESVIAACFGATPITGSHYVIQEQIPEKKKGLLDRLTDDEE